MKYDIITSNRFKKDLKRCANRGLNMRLIYDAMQLLAATGTQTLRQQARHLGMPYSTRLVNDLDAE